MYKCEACHRQIAREETQFKLFKYRSKYPEKGFEVSSETKVCYSCWKKFRRKNG